MIKITSGEIANRYEQMCITLGVSTCICLSLITFLFSFHAVCVSSPKAQVAFVLQKAQQRQSKCEWTCLRERSLSREGLCVNTVTAGQLTAAFKTTAFNIIFHPLSNENPGYKTHTGNGEKLKGKLLKY